MSWSTSANIAKAPECRLFVIGDVRDAIAPFEQQRRFAEKVRDAGHHAVVLQAEGASAEHHALHVVALRVATQCALGRSDDEIQRLIKAKQGRL
jgi:hypothetical protein